ncbi:MAG TPA: MauE/DoxX family redox-associated membrane protein [Nitrososphaera sp.]|nr:MauE/DoxX family redox-associated membrane protein [Nitrososphaera sp.]
MLTTRYFIIAVRVALAGVFLFSGVAKLFSPQPAAAFFSELFPLSANISLALVLILSALEILIALGLFLSLKLQAVSFVASLFLLFALAVGLFLAEEETSCRCFGELIESKTDEMFVVRTLGVLALSLIVLRSSISHVAQHNTEVHEQAQNISLRKESL